MAAITVSDLTAGENTLTGTGVFDELMRSVEAHIEREYSKGRIKGGDYATVYLGALQSVMDRSLQFLMQEQRADLEAQLLQEQIETENLNQLQVTQQTQNLVAEKARIESQTALSNQQKDNLVAEGLNIPKQGVLLDKQSAQVTSETARSDAQKLQIDQQTSNLSAEALNIPKQGVLLDKQSDQVTAEISRIGAQENLITEQVASEVKQNELNGILDKQKAQIEAQTTLTVEQQANAVIEGTVLTAQKCKLDAEFDVLGEQKLKTVAETALLGQKKITEEAQVSPAKVDTNSLIGRQTEVHKNQAAGFIRDAEQKTAKIMSDNFNVRQTTEGGLIAPNFGFSDAEIKSAIDKLREGVDIPVI